MKPNKERETHKDTQRHLALTTLFVLVTSLLLLNHAESESRPIPSHLGKSINKSINSNFKATLIFCKLKTK